MHRWKERSPWGLKSIDSGTLGTTLTSVKSGRPNMITQHAKMKLFCIHVIFINFGLEDDGGLKLIYLVILNIKLHGYQS